MQSFHTGCRMGVKLYWSPPEADSIDLKYFRKVHTWLLKAVTVHMHEGTKNQAMKFRKFPTNRTLLRHRSKGGGERKGGRHQKAESSQEHYGGLHHRGHSATLLQKTRFFPELELNNEHKTLQRNLCTNRGAGIKAAEGQASLQHSINQDFMGEWSELKLLLRKSHMTGPAGVCQTTLQGLWKHEGKKICWSDETRIELFGLNANCCI